MIMNNIFYGDSLTFRPSSSGKHAFGLCSKLDRVVKFDVDNLFFFFFLFFYYDLN